MIAAAAAAGFGDVEDDVHVAVAVAADDGAAAGCETEIRCAELDAGEV